MILGERRYLFSLTCSIIKGINVAVRGADTPNGFSITGYANMNSLPHACGVYKITCITNGKIYIGSSVDMGRRMYRHVHELSNNIHHNEYLQRAFIKYGRHSFRADVLEECSRQDVINREQYYLDTLKPFGDNGFNIAPRADLPSLGGKQNLGRKLSPEHRAKIGAAGMGKTHTPEARKKISLANKGRIKSPEWRKNISVGKKKSMTLEQREVIRKRNTGHIHSDEHKAKISASLKGRPSSQNRIDKISKMYVVTSPNGDEFTIKNLAKFCKENGLDAKSMSKVARGKRYTSRGWRCRYA